MHEEYDKELVREILSRILIALDTILYRFSPVKRINDFTDSSVGMDGKT